MTTHLESRTESKWGYPDFFTAPLDATDPELIECSRAETQRQRDGIELIASENLVSRAVLESMASVFTNKYAEGYPHKRYYGGCAFADAMEDLAMARAKTLFNCAFANVQPHSGSQANQAVFFALMQPGDTYLAMALDQGGHLTHGAPPNMSGKWFKPFHYGLTADTQRIDYDQLRDLARRHRPKLIIAGGSAYSRFIDFETFRAVADEIGAYFLVDMAHFAGLVAGEAHPSPLPHAHAVTTTTHKTLRCARGGMVLTQDAIIDKKIRSAVFPGLQGGPLLALMAGKAAGFGEALRPSFKTYCRAVVDNAQALASTLSENNFNLVSGGTDNHLMLVDLSSKGVTGDRAEKALDRAGITCNKNSVPNDTQKPTVTSGIRLGSPAATTRGFRVEEFKQIGLWITEIIHALDKPALEPTIEKVKKEVKALCERFPIYETL